MPDKYGGHGHRTTQLQTRTEIASKVDFVFCAVDMKKDEIRALEEKLTRKLECPVCLQQLALTAAPRMCR